MKLFASNRRARHDYFVEKKVVAGMVLCGSEVKAIRLGRMSLRDAFVDFRNSEAWLIGAHIGEYPYARHYTHEPTRERKLLLSADEIYRLQRKVREKGHTIVPLDVHLSESGWIKMTLGLARGKRKVDKKETIKARDRERDMKREMNQHR